MPQISGPKAFSLAAPVVRDEPDIPDNFNVTGVSTTPPSPNLSPGSKKDNTNNTNN